MRQALAVALQDYEGAVVLVAHDRHLLRAVADELILVDAGRASSFDGDLEDYARWFMTSAAQTQEEEIASKPAPEETNEQKKQRKRLEAERRNRLSPLRAEVARYEARIAELERRRAEVEAALSTPDIYGEQAKQQLQELLKKQTQLRRDLQVCEEAWVAASERLDAELAADPD
jgi:ATP-binding cassette subfamily F protein 3